MGASPGGSASNAPESGLCGGGGGGGTKARQSDLLGGGGGGGTRGSRAPCRSGGRAEGCGCCADVAGPRDGDRSARAGFPCDSRGGEPWVGAATCRRCSRAGLRAVRPRCGSCRHEADDLDCAWWPLRCEQALDWLRVRLLAWLRSCRLRLEFDEWHAAGRRERERLSRTIATSGPKTATWEQMMQNTRIQTGQLNLEEISSSINSSSSSSSSNAAKPQSCKLVEHPGIAQA